MSIPFKFATCLGKSCGQRILSGLRFQSLLLESRTITLKRSDGFFVCLDLTQCLVVIAFDSLKRSGLIGNPLFKARVELTKKIFKGTRELAQFGQKCRRGWSPSSV